MTYDHWKTTNPMDEFLGPALDAEDDAPDISDEMVAAFEIAYLIALYPDRHDFAGSPPGSAHFEAYRQGIRSALEAAANRRADTERKRELEDRP